MQPVTDDTRLEVVKCSAEILPLLVEQPIFPPEIEEMRSIMGHVEHSAKKLFRLSDGGNGRPFPHGACLMTCRLIMEYLDWAFNPRGPFIYVEGQFEDSVRNHRTGEIAPEYHPHHFILSRDGKHIFDPTGGQFMSIRRPVNPSWRIFDSTDKAFRRYRAIKLMRKV